nr:hypothetical protein [Endozoicomonas sp.]
SVPDNLGNISIDQRKVDQNLGTSDDYESFTLIDVSELKNRRPSGDGAVCDTSKEIRKVYKLTSALAGAKPMNPDEIATQVKRFEESSDLICAQSDGNSLGSLDATEITGYTTWSGYCVSIVYALGQQVATAVNGVSGYVTADKSQA